MTELGSISIIGKYYGWFLHKPKKDLMSQKIKGDIHANASISLLGIAMSKL